MCVLIAIACCLSLTLFYAARNGSRSYTALTCSGPTQHLAVESNRTFSIYSGFHRVARSCSPSVINELHSGNLRCATSSVIGEKGEVAAFTACETQCVRIESWLEEIGIGWGIQ